VTAILLLIRYQLISEKNKRLMKEMEQAAHFAVGSRHFVGGSRHFVGGSRHFVADII
jgi:hypothetical protein